MLISFHPAKITHSARNSQDEGYVVESLGFDMPQLGVPKGGFQSEDWWAVSWGGREVGVPGEKDGVNSRGRNLKLKRLERRGWSLPTGNPSPGMTRP